MNPRKDTSTTAADATLPRPVAGTDGGAREPPRGERGDTADGTSRAADLQPIGRRILLVRLSAIGDIVMASPLIDVLRRGRPDAHIAWLVQSELAELLELHPALDEVIALPRSSWEALWRARRWRELLRSVRSFARELRARRFDTAIDLQGLLKSGVWPWLAGAPRRIGLGSREGSAPLMTRVLERGGDPEWIGSEYRYLAEALGLPALPFDMHVELADEDRASAAELLRGAGLAGAYAVVCPFTTRPQKHWFADRWCELVPELTRSLGLGVVMLGGPGDREAAKSIAGAAATAGAGRFASAVGATTLRGAAALIDGAELVIGVDTGMTHMGVAFGTPTVALFGSTRPYTQTGQQRVRVLHHALPCSPCRYRPTCGGDFTCMRLIDVKEVLDAALAVTAGPPRGAAGEPALRI